MPPKRKSKKRSRPEPQAEDLIDENHREEIEGAFESALKKGKKLLSLPDSRKCLKALGIDAKSDEIQSFFTGKNTADPIEELDKDAFVRFAAAKLIQIENAHKAFGLVDKDEKGVVVLEDLQRVARELGEDFSEEELNEMIALVDRSGDGFLRPKDFVRIARKINL